MILMAFCEEIHCIYHITKGLCDGSVVFLDFVGQATHVWRNSSCPYYVENTKLLLDTFL